MLMSPLAKRSILAFADKISLDSHSGPVIHGIPQSGGEPPSVEPRNVVFRSAGSRNDSGEAAQGVNDRLRGFPRSRHGFGSSPVTFPSGYFLIQLRIVWAGIPSPTGRIRRQPSLRRYPLKFLPILRNSRRKVQQFSNHPVSKQGDSYPSVFGLVSRHDRLGISTRSGEVA